jgi:ABC-2 type transport system ATP-binding protein
VTAAVTVADVHKSFRLEHDAATSIKGAVLRGLRRGEVEEFWALRGVSLEVPHGSTFGLVGHNGSGKSTLLKCMARILRPNKGSIHIDGRMSALLELGAGFHPELSGRENVFLNAAILGLPAVEVRKRFDDIVGFAGLEHFIDTPVKNYSSGMYVRLGFSVAINIEPDVLLVDEVLAVGDEEFQQRCLGKFAELRAQGKTVVVVSHSLGMVRSLCDEAAWLDAGRLRARGTADEVVDAYLDHVRHGDGSQPQGLIGDGPVRALSIHGADGAEVRQVRLGEPIEMRARLDGSRVDHDGPLTLLFELRRREGILVSRSTIDLDGGTSGEATYTVPSVHLVPSDYTLSASLVDRETGKLVTAGDALTPLRIVEPDGPQRFGVVDLAGRPSWSPEP